MPAVRVGNPARAQRHSPAVALPMLRAAVTPSSPCRRGARGNPRRVKERVWGQTGKGPGWLIAKGNFRPALTAITDYAAQVRDPMWICYG